MAEYSGLSIRSGRCEYVPKRVLSIDSRTLRERLTRRCRTDA